MEHEVGKIEKFDLSSIRIPKRVRDEMSTKIMNLDVGQGFRVSGTERDGIMSRVQRHQKDTGKKFTVRKDGLLKYTVIRTA